MALSVSQAMDRARHLARETLDQHLKEQALKRERLTDLRNQLAGATRMLRAVLIERDALKSQIHELDPYCEHGKPDATINQCRDCGESCCSECHHVCPNPNCRDTDPHDREAP